MLGFSPQTHVTQTQTANSSIIQSAKLLQFTREDLETYLLEQQRRNPLIELDNLHDPTKASAEDTPTPAVNPSKPESFSPASPPSRVGTRTARSGDGLSQWEDFIPQAQTLSDHLLQQIGSSLKTKADHEIAYHLIRSIDDDGYLRSSVQLLSLELDQPIGRIEEVLDIIQQMDPPGVAARTLAECLCLQLQEQGNLTPAYELLLKNLPLLANHKLRELAAICKVSTPDITSMAKVIKSLNPRPGSKFANAPVITVVPDVYVTMQEDGTFITSLNDQALPRVLVNRQYYSEIRRQCNSSNDIKFVADCMREANMLVRGLEQRAQTILKVASEIVLHQREFLLKGPEHLKPLILRDIADKIGVHQSTVSRAIANKHIMTSVGLFEMKYFLNNSVSSDGDGENLAANVVRHKIRQMIQSERPEKVLSDDDIVRDLAAAGIQLARRTVAKYREGMNIPSSHQRRRILMTESSQV